MTKNAPFAVLTAALAPDASCSSDRRKPAHSSPTSLSRPGSHGISFRRSVPGAPKPGTEAAEPWPPSRRGGPAALPQRAPAHLRPLHTPPLATVVNDRRGATDGLRGLRIDERRLAYQGHFVPEAPLALRGTEPTDGPRPRRFYLLGLVRDRQRQRVRRESFLKTSQDPVLDPSPRSPRASLVYCSSGRANRPLPVLRKRRPPFGNERAQP